MVLLHWNFVDSLFMVLTTVTTVGYEEVHPLGEGGRVFTMTVIVLGVGTMLYTLGILAETLIEGHLGRYARMRGMERRIAGLTDHFIVCGYGRMGTRLPGVSPARHALRRHREQSRTAGAAARERSALRRGGRRLGRLLAQGRHPARQRAGHRGRLRRAQRLHHPHR